MKKTVPFVRLFIGLTVLLTAAPGMAEPLTLEGALTRVLGNHPALTAQQYGVDEAQGARTTAGLLPNPTLSYVQETLSHRGQNAGERILGASLPLDFLWTRGPQIHAAEAQLQTARLDVAHVEATLRFAVQKAFVEAYYADRLYQDWETANQQLERVATIGQLRLEEGDIGQYDQQRIALEALSVQRRAAEAQLQRIQTQQQLAFLLDPDDGKPLPELNASFPGRGPSLDLPQLQALALKNRPEVQQAQAHVQVRQAQRQALARQGWPSARVFLGYKTQEDDFKGLAAELNVDLPLFDRQQGAVQQALAAEKKQAVQAQRVQQQVVQAVQQAYAGYQLYAMLLERVGDKSAEEDLLAVAQYSYEEGEMSLVALLDGIQAHTEAFERRYEILTHYQLSLFELERATATPIAPTEKTER